MRTILHKAILSLSLMVMCWSVVMSQTTVTGIVTDAESGELLIGVNILVKGTVKGTITDLQGNYSIEIDQSPPFVLIYSSLGYETQSVEITETNGSLDIGLIISSILSNEIVVSASRVEEKILESPVSIEKLDLLAIKSAASADFYDEVSKLKGVTTNQASLTFLTINTRGFATAGNTRFVQLMDGMDNAAPLLNFPTGNVVGISELDIKNMELIPGTASALYGPNAFNGILLMNSKDPFNYQGLSVQLKSGLLQSDAFETPFSDIVASPYSSSEPFYNAAIRYAKSFNDKFAFKINLSYLKATDWQSNDYLTHRPTNDLSVSPDVANFDGLNTYGDETIIPVGTGLTRTGWAESLLLESSDAKSVKGDAALHYRINDRLETNFSYRRGSGSTVYQGSERYALRDFVQQFIKWELNGPDFNIRAYQSATDDGDSYNMTALGAFVNEAIFDSVLRDENGNTIGGWAVAVNLALNGAFASIGVPGNDLAGAKQFADNGGTSLFSMGTLQAIAPLLAPQLGISEQAALGLLINSGGDARPADDSPELAALVDSIRTGLFQRGGAGFIDDSKLYHVEGNYDLTSKLNNVIGLQVGANFRRYDLFTDGTVFNEDPDGDGTNERIGINEWGAYLQASKRVANDRLKFVGSIRYDKNENFAGNFTPKVAAVYSMGENNEHNIRASYQTGFRNPTTQGQYIYFPTTTILLGSTPANAERYGIHNGGAWTAASWQAFLQSGDDTVLETIDLEYIKPEKLTAIEIGYKGIINRKLFLDVSVYRNSYVDFIDQINVVNKEATMHKGQVIDAGTVWRPYINVDADITSIGATLGFSYKFPKGFLLNGNYAYADSDFDEDAVSGYKSQFNTPQNKINIGIENRKLIDNLGFGINYSWQQEHFYISSFGEGTVPSYSNLNAQFSYNIKSIKTVVKLGASNILKNEYRTNIGNPYIGRTIFLSLTFDEFSR